MNETIEVKTLGKKLNREELNLDSANVPVNLFGHELIRSELLTNLLGKDAESILYWAGKELARNHPLTSYEEIVHFFEQASFGSLTCTKEKRSSHTYILSGEIIDLRLASKDSVFSLEAGFLAEQMQQITEMYTEAFAEVIKNKEVVITLKWDKSDSVDSNE
ncbi:YslB family protein [Desemzia sp. FAM 24101]|uniref:YslB family protein n=1 Tax=Desemzia sp. FAM 24101 TaxID=3259522 RepID=UPI00388EC34B